MKLCNFIGHDWHYFSRSHHKGAAEYRICLNCHKASQWMWQNKEHGRVINGVSEGRMEWVEVDPENWWYKMEFKEFLTNEASRYSKREDTGVCE
jgi:hypothetical protein